PPLEVPLPPPLGHPLLLPPFRRRPHHPSLASLFFILPPPPLMRAPPPLLNPRFPPPSLLLAGEELGGRASSIESSLELYPLLLSMALSLASFDHSLFFTSSFLFCFFFISLHWFSASPPHSSSFCSPESR